MQEKNIQIELNKIDLNAIKEKKLKNLQDPISIINDDIKIDIIKKDYEIEIKLEKNIINKTNQCNFDDCKRKIRILDFQLKCRCGNVYCPKHRHFNDHKCTFDYKNEKIKLEKIIANKITKI